MIQLEMGGETVPAEQQRLERGQVFTPRWLADLIIATQYSWLRQGDTVIEPTCGPGAFLQALPDSVSAIGVEIDPRLAEKARAAAPNCQVITGDFRSVDLPDGVAAVIGNPPFELDFIDDLLARSWHQLRHEGEVGLILPAYALQTASRVCRYNQRWSIESQGMPRTIFKGLQKPLVWARFIKDDLRRMVGLLFYQEAEAVNRLPARYRTLFIDQAKAPLWPSVVEQALCDLGGEGDLVDVYRVIEGNRPSGTAHWKAQVRKVLQQSFVRTAPARYALNR